MWLTSLLANLKPDSQRSRPARIRKRTLHNQLAPRRLLLEALEDRCLMSYSIVDLGSLSAAAVNNAGQVAGTTGSHAAFWQAGVVTDLGTLGGTTSQAYDVNNSGQVVGYADTPAGTRHAFLVTPVDTNSDGKPDLWFRDNDLNGINDLMVDLGTLGGPTSEARAINNLGKVVGRADTSTNAGSYRAFLWDSTAGMQNMGTFGTSASEANAINDRGQVAGSAYTFPLALPYRVQTIQGFVWDPASGSTLLGARYSAQKVTGISDAGQIVGNSGYLYANATGPVNPTYYRATDAFLWQNGTMTSLGFTTQVDRGFQVSINNNAQVVGLGYLWQDGSRINLNSLIDPALGWTISMTSDINDAGQIVGQGTLNGATHAFVMSPADPNQVLSLAVTGFPSPATAGAAGSFTVTARNGFGTAASGYTGTVQFASSDAQALLPSPYTFTAADAGVHPFSATLKTAGTQSISAKDTTAGIIGSQANVKVNPAQVSTLTVAGFPSSTTAGVAGSVTVTARDAYGNTVTGYAGTVHFSSSDGLAALPPDSTLTNGSGQFSATLKTAGTQSITAMDTASAGLSGADAGITVNPAAASKFLISAPASVSAGVAFSLTVTVQDAYGNLVTGYTGTIRFTSTDSRGTLPANYTFTAADKGVHTFGGVKLRTRGNQTIRVFDTLDASITGSVTAAVV